MPPRLSICIPTYNRAEFLRQTLRSVAASLKQVSASCEVVVCDNASLDHTSEVLASFRNDLPNFRTFRNETNIGELNFHTTIHHGTGDYIWLLGDDDLLDPQAISTVLRRLEEDPDLVVCNHSLNSLDFSIRHREMFHAPTIPEKLNGRDAALANFGIALGFISAGIVRRTSLQAVPKEDFVYFATYGLSFFYGLGAALPADARVAFIRETWLHYRGGNSSINWENVFVVGVEKALSRLRKLGYSEQAIRGAKVHTVKYYFIPHLVSMKKHHQPTGGLIKRAFPVFIFTRNFILLALPISCLPSQLFDVAQKFRR